MSLLDSLFSLEGRHALVTGGGTGLAAEIARALHGAGARLTLVGRRAAPLTEQCGRLNAARPGTADARQADLSDPQAIAALAAELGEGQSPDILVNAAGVNLRQPAQATSLQDWDYTLRLNLTAPFLLAQALAPAMRQRGWGRIVNIGSLQSVRAFPDSMAYGAAKGAIVQLTRAMAQAWSGDGITCNAIAPGLFPTALTQALYRDPEQLARMAASTCVGRNGQLEDLHGLAIYLCSPASSFMTGQTLFLDGGFTAR